jgi:fatty-acid peroxygenase
MRTVPHDQTLSLWREGYAWMPNRRHMLGVRDFRASLLGQSVACVCGPEAAQRFYDEAYFQRQDAMPGPVQRTLTGLDAVHSLDGPPHRHRKDMFLALRDPAGVQALVDRVLVEWEASIRRWAGHERVVLFDEAAQVLTRAVCAWAGLPQDGNLVTSADLTALVDGFGTLGPRHWRGRRARARAEQRLEASVRRARAAPERRDDGSMFARIITHREQDGRLLEARTAAVEILNVLRPTAAIAWFVSFAAHALHRWPACRARLQSDDPAFAVAFAQEVRRFYPFAPFMGARAQQDVPWDDDRIEPGTLVLLDLFGHNHDENLWEKPWHFVPERFLGHRPGQFDLVPQGAGDPATGHRCPGEDIVVATLAALVPRLARLEYEVPDQDLAIPLARIPTRPRSGVVLDKVRTR